MVTRAGPARDVSTYRGARWAAARAGPWPASARLELPAVASNTRASGRAVASNTRERAVEQAQVTHASERSSTREY